MNGYIYLASPYSHKDPEIMDARFEIAEFCVAFFSQQNKHVYSPILHYHEVAKRFKLPTDFKYWKQNNIAMIRSASEFHILNLPGCHRSVGVMGETHVAELLGFDIRWWDWEEIADVAGIIGERQGVNLRPIIEQLAFQEAADLRAEVEAFETGEDRYERLQNKSLTE